MEQAPEIPIAVGAAAVARTVKVVQRRSIGLVRSVVVKPGCSLVLDEDIGSAASGVRVVLDVINPAGAVSEERFIASVFFELPGRVINLVKKSSVL
jgi:hypothetical protein